MEQPKKQWQEPRLVVLVRSKPEEAVLKRCKIEGYGGPMEHDIWCTTTIVYCEICYDTSGWS